MLMICCETVHSIFFFFQAEDGIRDGHVTGVQTCALPIFTFTADIGGERDDLAAVGVLKPFEDDRGVEPAGRSEERRVGKSAGVGGGRTIATKNKAMTLLPSVRRAHE